MAPTRDDFKRAIIDILAKRVGYLCSNPDCRRPTSGANELAEKSTIIGVAAHITGASIGGPRYDIKLSKSERAHIDNGIWLCSNCATLIDKDEKRYPIQLLKKWKEEAEEESRSNLNRLVTKTPTNSHVLNLKADSSTALNDVIADFKNEKIKLAFYNGTDLNRIEIVSLLDAFYDDIIHGKLRGGAFSTDQIVVETDAEYDRLKSLVRHSNRIDIRRKLKKLEAILIDGIIIILNYGYFKDKQVHNTYQACFWFARAMRYWIIGCMRETLSGEEKEKTLYGQNTMESPILAYPNIMESFYNFKLIKIDLWHPKKDGNYSTSVYLPIDGFAGKWFSEMPQLSGPYKDHYSPNDFYNFILPQMVMKHIINNKIIIEDWEGYYIGCA
ncbi:hypothetical protein D3H65_04070 [Paraflavitalea soli]|uniref:HNH endonuclease n=1 Tax=Paraflavitalea soli TaxID=2315862 RepID=A0A3B7MIZ0_9BACT|nr:hypothetical protein [Paraflavitalea soli]AXY73199.1 hypothetical protein D3H65_04070 [Paraflavitalea soli]